MPTAVHPIWRIDGMLRVTRAPTGVAVAEEMAAEPISLTIGGRSHWGVAVFDNEAKPNNDELRISNDALLTFTGSTVLDSGLEVGMRIEIEGEKADDQGDAKYASVSGSFGEIRIGNEDTAGKKMATTAPYATYFYGINDAYWSFSASSAYEGAGSETWMTTYADAGAGASASLLYFSPVINGFQFGVSYAPEAGKEAQSTTASTDEGGEVYSLGLRYDGSFGDTGITFAGGYASKDVAQMAAVAAAPGLFIQAGNSPEAVAYTVMPKADQTEQNTPNFVAMDDEDEMPDGGTDVIVKEAVAAVPMKPGRSVTEWAGGIVVSMSGVSVGGSMSVLDDDMGDDDLTQYDLGIKYGQGPWAISANMGNASDDDQGLDTDFVRLLANYNLGPGINLAGAVGSDSPDTGNDTTFAGIALGISF